MAPNGRCGEQLERRRESRDVELRRRADAGLQARDGARRAARARARAGCRPCRRSPHDRGRAARARWSRGLCRSLLSCAWLVGVKDWRRLRFASVSSSTLSPKFAAAVPRRVAGGDQKPPCTRLDNGATTGEDRGVARAAAARHEQFVAVGAERVEDAQPAPVGARDQHDVALVGGSVAEVAAGRRDYCSTGDVQRGCELLVGCVARDADRPAAGLVPVAQRELVDQPVGRGRVDETAVGVGDRAGGGDLRAPAPACDAAWRERPEDASAIGIDRDRLAVCASSRRSRCAGRRRR